MLRRGPGFAAVALLSLNVGIGFNTALLTLVDVLLLRPPPVERADRLVEVFTSLREDFPYFTSSYPDFLDFKAQNDVFVDILGYRPSAAEITLTDHSRPARGEIVTGNDFGLLGVKPALLTVGRVQPLCTIGPVCFTM
jgi:putative ABC transport system permease protein